MAEKEEKSPITPTLRVMKICEEFTYPIQMMTSISDFERACGLSNGYVHKIKNSVGKRGLLDIQRKFPELNTDWLLTGEGEMLNDTSSYIVNSDHHGTSVAGNGNNVNTTSALEKALESLMEQQRLTAKAQEQVDRLLSLMERMTK